MFDSFWFWIILRIFIILNRATEKFLWFGVIVLISSKFYRNIYWEGGKSPSFSIWPFYMYENKSSFDLYISLVALVFKHSLFFIFLPKKSFIKKNSKYRSNWIWNDTPTGTRNTKRPPEELHQVYYRPLAENPQQPKCHPHTGSGWCNASDHRGRT